MKKTTLENQGRWGVRVKRGRRVAAAAAVACVLLVLLAPAALGQFQYERLKSFGFPEQSETSPNGLIEASDGALYGTTRNRGTVFKLNKDGTGYTVLRRFTGTNGDAIRPIAALVESRDGSLYGMTQFGGTSGVGSVFKLNKDGTGYTVVYSFSLTLGFGIPLYGFIEGSDGALYGTAGSDSEGFSTVFKLDKGGSGQTLLRWFTGYPSYPSAVIEGRDGALYGTTRRINLISPFYMPGAGTVFRVNKDGSGYAELRSFSGASGGYTPDGALVEASDGALYGTASADGGGFANGNSAVFKLNKDGGDYTVLRRFTSTDGRPSVALREGRDGALYGTTYGGGINGNGTLFKLNNDGSGYTVLHSFTGEDGSDPFPLL